MWLALTTIVSIIGGTGVSGWVNPKLPVIGPIVTAVVSMAVNSSHAAPPGIQNNSMQQAPSPVQVRSGWSGTVSQWVGASSSIPVQPHQPLPAQNAPGASRLGSGTPLAAPVQNQTTLHSKPTDAVLICSFNIQVFGESKLGKPDVVNVLTQVVRMFDIVAIQEVRAKSDSIVPTFVQAVNADGSQYHWVIGPRLGRTSSKEQYTFVYDTTRVEVDSTTLGTAPNPKDLLHRPPMFARFRTRASPPEAAFSFWLVDIHTDPDEVPQEVDALADVFVAMQQARSDEDDVILLGDLNAAPKQFGRIATIPNITWAVSGTTTNTRRSKTYDNIVFSQLATREYQGRWGVLDLQSTFGLSLDAALRVSDHNPVWASFSPWEVR